MGRNHITGVSSGGNNKGNVRNGPRSVGTYSLAQAAEELRMEEDGIMRHVRKGNIQMCNGGIHGEDYFLGGQIDFLKTILRSAPMEFKSPVGK